MTAATLGFTLSERYPDQRAVLMADDVDLVRDFNVGLTLPSYNRNGVVTGWLSREITRRGIQPHELPRFKETSPAW